MTLDWILFDWAWALLDAAGLWLAITRAW